ncbi:MAG TPA: protein-glutamate O-methyltransferase CheR, partial [Polyangiales bacterium]|nr:protein-glutamate O-methyltransferase CheR [Polyangiales bacterium]
MHAEPKLEQPEYQAIADLLFEWTGIRLQNKQQMVLGRLKPRLRELGLGTFREYVRKVRQGGRGGPEAQRFINQLTTNKTSFFREPHHFEYLKNYLTRVAGPRAMKRGDRRVRVWSAACSTGEEPYSLAMVLADALPTSAGWDIRVRATDIDTACLQTAQRAEYDQERAEDVPVQLRSRMLEPASPNKLRVAPDIARLVQFEQLNLVRDRSFGNERFDAIFCRNVIIYFDLETQQSVVERLSQRLVPGGRLYLGHSETLVNTQLQRVDGELGVYQVAAGRRGSIAPP